ncbi:hypothetical protein ACEPAH_1599 [Sanghuangporus vaninii]
MHIMLTHGIYVRIAPRLYLISDVALVKLPGSGVPPHPLTQMSSPLNASGTSFPATSDLLHAELKDNLTLILAGIAALFLSMLQYLEIRKKDVNVPAAGPSGRLTSYIGAIKMLAKTREMLEEGYQKYSTFKLPMFNRWLVIVNTPELIEEIRKAPDDKVSFIAATEDILAVKYTMGPSIHGNHYHVSMVRSQLTRNLGVLYTDIYDEVSQAFEENIPGKPDEWVSLNARDTVMQVVARTSNRVFVGLPLCRDKDWIELSIRYTLDVVKGALIINLVPDFLKTLVGEFLTSVPRSTRRALKHLQPIIEYRLAQAEKYGKDWPGKPNDMLSWLMDDGPEDEKRNAKALTHRILTLNFAAVHTSSISFTHALLQVAAHPEDIKPLREEIERIVKEYGWSKASLAKMQKIDSYIKETLRFDGIGMLSMQRKILQDYTLSDGTFLPAGTHVACNSVATHFDESNYQKAGEFDGFRFVQSNSNFHAEAQDLEESAKDQVVSTSLEFLTFGHGRHACPGRFFAANELKTMLAYLVANYDLKLEDEQPQPRPLNVATATIPDPKARVLFRKRFTS